VGVPSQIDARATLLMLVDIVRQAFTLENLLILSLLMLATGTAAAIVYSRPPIARLRRHGAAGQARLNLTTVASLFSERDLRGVRFRALRTSELPEFRLLDVDRTIDETICSGGLFQPVYSPRRGSVEYDILIDRLRASDHLAALCRQYVDGLVAADTRCNVYQFHRDPRQCFDATGRSHALADLSRRSFESRLIIMSDGAGLCDPVTGKPGRWIEDARAWDRRIIVSPKHPTLWSEIERSLQEEGPIPIVPATGRWIEYVAMRLSASEVDIREDPGTPEEFRRLAPLSYLLSEEPLRFIEEAEPTTEVLRLTGEALKRCLTSALHDWLAACAVFPVLNWQVTSFLGRGLLDDSGRPLLTEDRILVLSQLPWFRQGWMPSWLRRLLISDLSEDRYLEIRALLESSLALDGSGALDAMPLRVALERQTSDAGRPSATADAILLEFVLRQRGKGLDFHLVASAFLAALRQPSGQSAGALLATIVAEIDALVGDQANTSVKAVEVAAHGGSRDQLGNEWMASLDAICATLSRSLDPADWRAVIVGAN
jgi:hypothetical protein